MLTAQARGVCVICPTPFLPDGALDERSAASMTEAYVAAGATGLTILGIMGEVPKLDADESLRLVRIVLRHAAGLPVIVGVGRGLCAHARAGAGLHGGGCGRRHDRAAHRAARG